jgi:hypothetical protein
MTSEADYSRRVLDAIQKMPSEFMPADLDEKRRNNAAKAMMAVVVGRLENAGEKPEHLKHTRYQWRNGVISVRNSRIVDHHWSSIGDFPPKPCGQ